MGIEFKTVMAIDTLKALLLVAAKKDIRRQLNGVCFEVRSKVPRLIATNGISLLAMQLGTELVDCEDFEAIIPRGDLELAIKGETGRYNIDVTIMVEAKNLAKFTAGKVSGDCTEMLFPDWRRVMPKQVATAGECIQMTPDGVELAALQRAVKMVTGGGRGSDVHALQQCVGGSFTIRFHGGAGILMPVPRSKEIICDLFPIG